MPLDCAHVECQVMQWPSSHPLALLENSQSIAYALRAPLSCDQSAAVAAMTCQALEPDFVRYHSLFVLVAMPLPDSMGAVDQLKRTITKAGLTPQRDGRLRLKVPTRKKKLVHSEIVDL